MKKQLTPKDCADLLDIPDDQYNPKAVGMRARREGAEYLRDFNRVLWTLRKIRDSKPSASICRLMVRETFKEIGEVPYEKENSSM